MKTIKFLSRTFVYIILLTVFLWGLSRLIQRTVINRSGPAPASQTLITAQHYPYPHPDSPELTATLNDQESEPPYPGPDEIAFTPRVPGEEVPPVGPLPSPTHYEDPVESLVLTPGPTPIPIVGIQPALIAEGRIIYLVIDAAAQAVLVEALTTDKSGGVSKDLLRLSTPVMNQHGKQGYLSPDGSRLALQVSGESIQILIYQIDAGNLLPLPGDYTVNYFYNWFPDGLKMLVSASGRLSLLDPATGDHVVLTAGSGVVLGAATAPDGSKVVYARQAGEDKPSSVWMINSNGGEARLLFEQAGTAGGFSWSPDGSKIIFTADQWLVMNSDGSGLRQIGQDLPPPLSGCTPPAVWSPDGQTVAVLVASDRLSVCRSMGEAVSQDVDIALIDVESGKSQLLLPDLGAGNTDPAWSPDGSKLVFVSNRSGANEIWVVNADGSGLEQVTDTGENHRFPIWARP